MDNYQQRVYNADSSSKVDVSINDLKLWVEGFCLCGIKSLGPIFLDQRDPSQEMHWVRQMLSSLTFSVEHAKKKKKKALLRTLAADVHLEGGYAVSRGHAIDFSYEEREIVSRRRIGRRSK